MKQPEIKLGIPPEEVCGMSLAQIETTIQKARVHLSQLMRLKSPEALTDERIHELAVEQKAKAVWSVYEERGVATALEHYDEIFATVALAHQDRKASAIQIMEKVNQMAYRLHINALQDPANTWQGLCEEYECDEEVRTSLYALAIVTQRNLPKAFEGVAKNRKIMKPGSSDGLVRHLLKIYGSHYQASHIVCQYNREHGLPEESGDFSQAH